MTHSISHHALVVDDSVIIQKVHSVFLKSLSFEVTVVGTGEEAITLLQTNPAFDAILLDIDLPGMNGYEVCRIIRETLHNKSIPIIGISTYTVSEIRAKCLSVGMNEIYTKPITSEDLEEFLEEFWSDPEKVDTKFDKLMYSNEVLYEKENKLRQSVSG